MCIPSDEFSHARKKLGLEITRSQVLLKSEEIDNCFQISDIERILCFLSEKPPQANTRWWTAVIFVKKMESLVFEFLDFDSSSTGKSQPQRIELDVHGTTADHKGLTALNSALEQLDGTKLKIILVLKELLRVTILEPTTCSAKKKPFIDCYLKAKSVTLFFFEEGLFLGLKKPIRFISIPDIANVHVEDSGSRSFNMILQTKSGEVIEFSMIDKVEEPAVSSFLKRVKMGLKPTKERKEKDSDDITTNTTNNNNNCMEGSGDSDSSEEDEDFVPAGAEDEIPEEYDEGEEEDDVDDGDNQLDALEEEEEAEGSSSGSEK